MSTSLRALLSEVLDYAGLFPPAGLPLEEALRNYARYRQQPENWLLGRFVCPAGRLEELSPWVEELFSGDNPLLLSLLGTGGKTSQQFLANLKNDLFVLAKFRVRHREMVAADVYEVRLPEEITSAGRKEPVATLLEAAAPILKNHWVGPLTPFYEAGFEEGWRSSLPAILGGIAQARSSGAWAGFKLRCGGLKADAFPSTEQVALVLAACREEGIPWKATAGLHHPLRYSDPGIGTTMHGFVNVFGAGVLAHARHPGPEILRKILEEEDAGNFHFGDNDFRWQNLQVATAEITAARREGVTSFGSCSFEEPCADLRNLGWLC
ncbi:MAG: hypothetical protein JO112_13375 [Planctomycetes bacterium]|nr:hypothetical protein [Planctomycetota bacterium]